MNGKVAPNGAQFSYEAKQLRWSGWPGVEAEYLKTAPATHAGHSCCCRPKLFRPAGSSVWRFPFAERMDSFNRPDFLPLDKILAHHFSFDLFSQPKGFQFTWHFLRRKIGHQQRQVSVFPVQFYANYSTTGSMNGFRASIIPGKTRVVVSYVASYTSWRITWPGFNQSAPGGDWTLHLLSTAVSKYRRLSIPVGTWV